MKQKIEYRAFPFSATLETRAGEGKMPTLVGHAAVFNTPVEIWKGFREQVVPGAFSKTIKEADIRCLWNHDPNYVLGRNKSATLRLAEDQTGLAIENDPPDATWARDLVTTLKRGDVDQMSFAFRTVKDSWEEMKDGSVLRTLLEVKLYDVSPVTFPAYPTTDIQARCFFDAAPDDIRARIPEEILRSGTEEPSQAGHSPEAASGIDIAVARRRLEIAEKEEET